jgi:predicted PurR-regulated permease PerM
VTALIDELAATVRGAGAAQPDDVIAVGLTVAQTVMVLLTLLTVVYFWLTERARLQRYILAFVPNERRRGTHRAWNASEDRLGRWVRGELILMGAIGLGTSVAYTLLGVPAALLLGLFSALAEAIPIVGPLIGAIPAVLVAATVSPQLALVVAGVYLFLQIIEGNVLVPIVMRNTIGISPFLVILSVLIGGAAGGFAGALLAVPIAAVGEILWRASSVARSRSRRIRSPPTRSRGSVRRGRRRDRRWQRGPRTGPNAARGRRWLKPACGRPSGRPTRPRTSATNLQGARRNAEDRRLAPSASTRCTPAGREGPRIREPSVRTSP